MPAENDIIIIYFEDKPLAFAKIEEITPDVKADWFNVKLLILKIPLQVVIWTLRDIYIDGAEFTMNNRRIRLEKVVCPEERKKDVHEKPDILEKKDEKPEDSGKAEIISFSDLKKK